MIEIGTPENWMIETPCVLWTVLDEKIFLAGVMDRLKRKSPTLDRFGAPRVFMERYLASLDQRWANFSRTAPFGAGERMEIRKYVECLQRS
jgi:hypothetical protein